jgi:replicative DNA helicase
MTPNFVRGDDALGTWRAGLTAGTPPTLYPVADPGTPLAGLEVGPGLVSLFGGAPAAGKTALVMQLAVDALRLSPGLKALVANVEMPPAALLDRQFARLSGIDLHAVRRRALGPEHADRVATAMATLDTLAPRLAFARPPWSIENVARSGEAVGADLIVLDYAQRFAPPGEHAHRKAAVDAVMEAVRGMADCGAAVVVVAAVGRQRDEKGRSGYHGLSLASFRESSELEYGADDAFLLVPGDPADPAAVTLKHAKSRHAEPRDLRLRFTGRVQRFDADDRRPDRGTPSAAVRDLWAGTTEPGEEAW